VANRRLQALLAPAPEGTAPDLEGRALPDAEDPGVAALREVALAAIGVARALTVRAEKIPGTLYASDIGVPANLLSRAWGTDTAAEEGEPAPEDIIDAFLAGLEGEALAWLRIAGEEVTGQGGDPGLLETMGEKAAVFLDGYFGRLETLFPGDPGLCAIAIAPADGWGPAVFFAEAGAESAFLAADPAGIAALTARWQRLIAG